MNLEADEFFFILILFFVASGFHFDHKIAEKIAFKLFVKKVMKALSRFPAEKTKSPQTYARFFSDIKA